ncbi:hypothetical protein SpCBS45565_g07630 [Spizellomyces sp. 'palustris']|nr:hypothetical protein SpCBS45565_g07630 [Spizellomyces sp. 'palustris']
MGQWEPCPVCDFPFEIGDPQFGVHVNGHYEEEETNQVVAAQHIASNVYSTLDVLAEDSILKATRPNWNGNATGSHTNSHQPQGPQTTLPSPTPSSSLLHNPMKRPDRRFGGEQPLPKRQTKDLRKGGEEPSKSASDSRMTPGVVPMLASLLRDNAQAKVQSKNSLNQTKLAYTCHSSIIHYEGSIMDRSWGCGYRNFQMLLSSLLQMPPYRDLVIASLQQDCDSGSEFWRVPEIATLQRMIESAWKAGFDQMGASHFSGRLVGSRKWIGATEIEATLLWMGIRYKLSKDDATIRVIPTFDIRVTVYDFHRPSGPDGKHHAVLDTVEHYFREAAREAVAQQSEGLKRFGFTSTSERAIITSSEKPPLYFQHQGHSRTIVGIETLRSGVRNLLVYDPSNSVAEDLRSPLSNSPMPSSSCNVKGQQKREIDSLPGTPIPFGTTQRLLRSYRVGLEQLAKHTQYQVITVTGIAAFVS